MLTVSKPITSTEVITEFPVNDRFIKLPIEGYLKLLPSPTGQGSVFSNLNNPQIALINAINDPRYRFVCAALSRRLGKTYIANIIGQLVVLVPGCNVLIMAPNYSLSQISFEIQRKLISTFDLEITKDNLKDRVIELSNGSTVRIGSISQVDSCVGRSYDLIIFDEAALSSDGEPAFNVSLRPTLDRPNSKCIFISTPRGKKNWFSVFYSRGFSKEYPEWISLTADWTENTRMSASDVNEAKRTMSELEFRQEYYADFNSFEGQIFQLSEEHIIESLPPGNYEFFAGLDPGYRDPTAFVVIAYDLENDWFYIVEDYLESEAVTAAHAKAFQKLIDKWGIDAIFIDSAAAQFGADLAYQYNIGTIKAKKAVLEGIAYVQTIVQQGRLKIIRGCDHVLDTMDQYQWDTRENLVTEKPKHDDYSHVADAIRYALYTFVTGQ